MKRLLFALITSVSLSASALEATGTGTIVNDDSSPTAANLWIDTNGGTCTRQGTAGTYVDAAACSSMGAAINACTAGDTIRMKAGTYGAQTITAVKTSPGCTVIAESTTNIGFLTTNGAYYEIQNINGPGWDVSAKGTNHITCRDCHFASSGAFIVNWWVTGSTAGVQFSDISWIGGSMSGARALNNQACAFCISPAGDVTGGTTFTASNLLIEGVDLNNNWDTAAGAGNHFEVIRIDGNIDGITFRRNKFRNNRTSTAQIFFSNARGLKPNNILFENNFFDTDPISAGFATQMNYQGLSTCPTWTLRYNTFKIEPVLNTASSSCTSAGTYTWIGNLAPRWGSACYGTTFTRNTWYGSSGAGACGGTDQVVTQASVNFDTDGYTLLTGSSAINSGETTCATTGVDIRNYTRPSGTACDAGAYEFGASP